MRRRSESWEKGLRLLSARRPPASSTKPKARSPPPFPSRNRAAASKLKAGPVAASARPRKSVPFSGSAGSRLTLPALARAPPEMAPAPRNSWTFVADAGMAARSTRLSQAIFSGAAFRKRAVSRSPEPGKKGSVSPRELVRTTIPDASVRASPRSAASARPISSASRLDKIETVCSPRRSPTTTTSFASLCAEAGAALAATAAAVSPRRPDLTRHPRLASS